MKTKVIECYVCEVCGAEYVGEGGKKACVRCEDNHFVPTHVGLYENASCYDKGAAYPNKVIVTFNNGGVYEYYAEED